MTASSMPCCRKRQPDALHVHRAVRWLARWLAWGLLALCLGARAEGPAEMSDMRLEYAEDGLYLSAALQFALPALAQDALHKGIPMYFVTEAEVVRDRWYWYDQRVASAVRHMRLSYQPLTRRWRLNVSPLPFDSSGLGVVLGQNFDELADVLAAMQRIARWKIADAQDIDPPSRYTVHLRFRLDMSQLPRPLQIGAMGRSGWNLSVARSQRLAAEPVR